MNTCDMYLASEESGSRTQGGWHKMYQAKGVKITMYGNCLAESVWLVFSTVDEELEKQVQPCC